MLTEAFVAVLDNAFEFMPRGGPISVSIAHSSHWVRVLFTDAGVGMAPGMWHKVFDPFFSTRGGLAIGLGLSFVDGVIAQHGGTLLLTSDVRVGTSLAIYLPRGSALAGPALPREE